MGDQKSTTDSNAELLEAARSGNNEELQKLLKVNG